MYNQCMINIHTVFSQSDDPMKEMPQYVIVTQAADGSRRGNRYPPNLRRAEISEKVQLRPNLRMYFLHAHIFKLYQTP